jgi:hypothetical protein
MLQGQSLQINGSAFDAIKWNPSADGHCFRGNTLNSSCCTTTGPITDVCGSGIHDPLDDKGTCVELYDGQGWWKLTVQSVTPTTIVTEIPSGTGGALGCLGDDSFVYVVRWPRRSRRLRLVERLHTFAEQGSSP